MRLFIGLELPHAVKDALGSWRKQLTGEYPALKWTSLENLHVTLRFLGNVNGDSVISEMERLQLERFLPVEFTLSFAGTFGRPPSILWLGGSFSPGIMETASLLGQIPDEKGATEWRRFIPHVTIARARQGHTLPEIPFPMKLTGCAGSIVLFASTLTPSGPVYSSLFSVRS